MNFDLLKQMCRIHAPSGHEVAMTEFLLNYINANKKDWKVQPQILSGEGFQDCIVLVFGKPKTAIYAHIDSIGFTVRYHNQLVKIAEFVNRNNIQFVASILKDKLPIEINKEEYFVVKLSQSDKLFRISE